MNQFVSNYLKPKWGKNVEICQIDTDDILFHVRTNGFYEDIKPDINKWLDTTFQRTISLISNQ
jgi:hypothetical protein